MRGGIETALGEVAFQRVEIGGEIEFVGHEAAAWRGGVEERGEQLVEVTRGRAGDGDLVGRGAEQWRELGGEGFAERNPRRVSLGPAIDAEGAPLGGHAGEVSLGAAGE